MDDLLEVYRENPKDYKQEQKYLPSENANYKPKKSERDFIGGMQSSHKVKNEI